MTTLYRNTLIEHADRILTPDRDWYTNDYPQDIIDNYKPGDTNYYFDNYRVVSFENIEYHYFMQGWTIITELVIRKYPDRF